MALHTTFTVNAEDESDLKSRFPAIYPDELKTSQDVIERIGYEEYLEIRRQLFKTAVFINDSVQDSENKTRALDSLEVVLDYAKAAILQGNG